VLAKEAPKFTFRTSLEYAAFDYTAVTYEWGSYFISFIIISCIAAVVTFVIVIITLKQEK
jgi:hypothetical protein